MSDSRKELERAMAEYFANGGKITKLSDTDRSEEESLNPWRRGRPKAKKKAKKKLTGSK